MRLVQSSLYWHAKSVVRHECCREIICNLRRVARISARSRPRGLSHISTRHSRLLVQKTMSSTRLRSSRCDSAETTSSAAAIFPCHDAILSLRSWFSCFSWIRVDKRLVKYRNIYYKQQYNNLNNRYSDNLGTVSIPNSYIQASIHSSGRLFIGKNG